jgi:hypothetical protein
VQKVNVWEDDETRDSDRYPYLVAAPEVPAELKDGAPGARDADSPDAASREVSQRFALVDADVVVDYRIAPGGLLDWLELSADTRVRRTGTAMRERLLRGIALREVTLHMSTQPLDSVLAPRGDSLVRTLRERVQAAFDAARTGVEVVALQVPALRPPVGEGVGMFEEVSIDVQNARKLREEAERTARATMAAIAGSPERAAEIVAAIEAVDRAEREQGPEAAAPLRAEAERLVAGSTGAAASVIGAARARRWAIVMGAAGDSAEVLGQAPSFRAAPELYKQFRTMQVLGRALSGVRVKYVLGPGVPGRAEIDMTMKQAESGLNLADYLEKKENPAAAGGN